MHRFIDGEDRMQQTLLPHSLEDYVSEENPVRVIEVFIEELDLAALEFSGMTPAATGRPAYHPSTLLMATSGKGTATVGYNLQIAVDAEHHLIVAHEVTNRGTIATSLHPWRSRHSTPRVASRSPLWRLRR